MNFSYKNFLSPNPKKVKRLAWAIKGFTGSIGAVAYLMNHPWVAISVWLLGAFSDGILEFFKEDGTDKL